MEKKDKDSSSFIPVIARLDRLDRVLQHLEEDHSLSRVDFCGAENNINECKTLYSALEEVQHKGTLLERLALLEKRVLELSLEVEGNTSKSSSSTVQVSETIGDKDSEATITTQEMENPPKIQAQEKASSGDGIEKENKSRGQKKKSQKKWLWLLRLKC